MSRYFNSIVTCHRGRRLALRAFLRAFSLAAKHIDKDSFEIVITDMDESSDDLIGMYSDDININHCKVVYDGMFCRGRALNHAVLHAQGEYVTPIDIDSIISYQFLSNIEHFYSSHRYTKLCHRIKKLNMLWSLKFIFSNFGEKEIKEMLEGHDKFPINRERYTKDEIIYTGGLIKDSWLNGDALGNSQFTLLKSTFMDIGGYDEDFIGYGSEDLDFNIRAYKHIGGGYLSTLPEHALYHLDNMSRSGGSSDKNYRLYLDNKINNVICIPISSEWGRF